VAKHEIRIDEQTVTFDDQNYLVERIGDGVYTVSGGPARLRVIVAGPADDCWVFVNGRVAQVEIVDAGRRTPRRIRSTSHEMSAPMPATVVKVLVEPQAHVSKGDTILILEAMKMELPVRAARDGVVRRILCSQGDLVQPGVNLVEIE
jgi:3-methylcrotonyl-CoA carboxylase alpha subunit